ncbi:MAG: cation:proton antiporter [Acidiferrobacterales bacterium]|jgi:Kef-type K+ transport system membrane component KefB|nr:cation:proton antiporter [Acidiferrobacterales bacterium]
MEIHNFLLQIAAIILTARVFAEVAAWMGAPPIVGELCAGIVLGPSLLGWIEPNNVINLLAEIGIILLLFEVGLETDIARLVRSGGKAAAVAVAGFVLPFILGFVLSRYLFSLELLPSLFIGGTLTATSIGITVRILSDINRHRSNEGQIVVGAAVLDDLLGIFLLAVLYQLSTEGKVDTVSVGRIVLFVGVFFFAAPVVAKLVAPLIKHFHRRSDIPGMIPILLVAMVLVFASTARFVGAPELLGGFVAGVALSRRFFLPFGAALHMDPDFTKHVHNEMKPIIHLFTPIFFVTVGLSLDLGAVDWSSWFIWMFSLTVTGVAILGKLGGPWVIRESIPARIAIGMAMVPRGEVGLVFAELGRAGKVFSQEVYAGMILVILYTTLASPFWIKSFYRVFGHRLPNNSE